MKKSILLFFIFFSFNEYSSAQTYTDIGPELDFQVSSTGSDWGNGVSFYDFNDDGWDDLSYGLTGEPPRFFLNNEGTFEEIDLNLESEVQTKSILWVDIDNDGDSDLFLSNYYGGNRLYLNEGDLEMTDISEQAGFFQNTDYETVGACWGDYDNDGLLDVYICNYNWELEFGDIHNFLYHNEGGGLFTDVTESAGVGNGLQQSFQGVWIDLNRDGLLDLSVINDRIDYANSFYQNNGDGTFTDIASDLHIDANIDAMSNTWGDYDNDGLMDLYLTNTEATGGNVTYKNIGNDFLNFSSICGTEVNDDCWNANWMDINNDMLQDLHVSVGYYLPGSTSPNYFYVNLGDNQFELAQCEFPNNFGVQYATAIGDYNNDGAVDMATSNNYNDDSNFWRNNNESGNNYIKISLEGTNVNTDGIGSYIEVWTGGIEQTRFTYCGEDYISQDSQREIFGMGTYQTVDSLIVTWQNGWIDSFYDLDVNQTFHIVEGESFEPTISSASVSLCEGETTLLSIDPNLSNILWSTEETTSTILVSESGTYTVFAINSYGFEASDEITVVINPIPIIDVEIDPNLCFGETFASINLINLSGTGYTINIWNDWSIGSNLNDLSAGEYSYNYIDSNFCSVTDTIEIIDPLPVIIDVIYLNDVSCHGICDAEVEIIPSGGIGPYIIEGDFELWCDGIYEIEIVDYNNCHITEFVEIEAPGLLLADLTLTDITDGELGSASLVISGGSEPYDIEWSNGDSGPTATNLNLNSYFVTILDANGCELIIDFEIVVSMDELISDRISIYPNPSLDVLHISGSNQLYNQIEIFDNLGKKVFSAPLTTLEIDISALTSGQYSVRIFSDNSTQIFKLIKL